MSVETSKQSLIEKSPEMFEVLVKKSKLFNIRGLGMAIGFACLLLILLLVGRADSSDHYILSIVLLIFGFLGFLTALVAHRKFRAIRFQLDAQIQALRQHDPATKSGIWKVPHGGL